MSPSVPPAAGEPRDVERGRRRAHCGAHMSMSFQRAVDVLAKRWTPLILFVLSEGPRRFNEIATEIELVSDRMLSQRLKELEAEGLVQRRIYAEVPVRVEYELTAKGRGLDPVFAAIAEWARSWVEMEDGERDAANRATETTRRG